MTPSLNLPELFVTIKSEITTSNLKDFEAAGWDIINGINIDPQIDEDFAHLSLIRKGCETAREKISAIIKDIDNQCGDISATRVALIALDTGFQKKAALCFKLETDRKNEIKTEKINAAKAALAEHVKALEKDIKPIRMMVESVDYLSAIKGKKNLDSVENAINQLLEDAKTSASYAASAIRDNLDYFVEYAQNFKFLFNDLDTIATKDYDVFKELVTNRIEAHLRIENEKAEIQRQKIRQEEEVKAQAKAEIQIKAAEAKHAQSKSAPEIITPQVAAIDANKNTARYNPSDNKTMDLIIDNEPKEKPSDDSIIELIIETYYVDRVTAITWILDMDRDTLVGELF